MTITGNNKTFTLIELIMVIVIIGILGMIAIPKFINFRRDAQNAAAEGTISALRSAISIYYSRSPHHQYLCTDCLDVSPNRPYEVYGETNPNCNGFRSGTSTNDEGACFPATIGELNFLLTAPSQWVQDNGLCYDSTNGNTYECP